MRALGRYVVVKPKKEEIESNGVFLSAKSEKNVRYLPGTVVTCGEDVFGLDEGDNIYYDKAAASSVRIKDDLYYVLDINGCVVKE